MRYPVDNFKTEWNGTAGNPYGLKTSYGYHEGVDINDNLGGNSDLGKPLYAIATGKILGIHKHTGLNNFGHHVYLQIDGNWGTRFIHYAHCNEIFVTEGQEVLEGFKIATLGNTGTVYAHCHFAIKKKANGMDTIATTKEMLDDAWEDPIKFIETNILPEPNPGYAPTFEGMTVVKDGIQYKSYKKNGVLLWKIEVPSNPPPPPEPMVTIKQTEYDGLKAQIVALSGAVDRLTASVALKEKECQDKLQAQKAELIQKMIDLASNL